MKTPTNQLGTIFLNDSRPRSLRASEEMIVFPPIINWPMWVDLWTDSLMPNHAEQLEHLFPHLLEIEMPCKCEAIGSGNYSLCRKHRRQLMKAHEDGSLQLWIAKERERIRAIVGKDPQWTAMMLSYIQSAFSQTLVFTHTGGHQSQMKTPPIIKRADLLRMLEQLLRDRLVEGMEQKTNGA